MISADQPPGEDADKRTHEGGNQVLEGDLQFSESEIDVQQSKEEPTDDRPDHPDREIGPPPQALFGKRDQPCRDRPGKSTDDQPDYDFGVRIP